MKHTWITLPAGAATALAALAPGAAGAATKQGKTDGERPHIILLMVDQCRFDVFGCAGNTMVHTPHIDALAREGNLFVNAYSSVPSSTAARSGLLTGLSPWHHGMLGYGQGAETYKYEMGRMMSENGYYTYAVGKMHWEPQDNTHGYHTVLTDEEGRDTPGRKGRTKNFVSDYHQWFQTNAPGQDPDATGIRWNAHLGRVYQLDERLHPTTWTAETASRVIENYDLKQPLFLKVSFARPHSPYDPPQRFYDMYKGKEVPAPVQAAWSRTFFGTPIGDDQAEAKPEAFYADFNRTYVEESRRHYYGSVSFLDEKVGRIVALLKQKGMYDNALIVFFSDHGDMLGDHCMWRKGTPYEGSAAIPFVVKWPSSLKRTVAGGTPLDYVVELRDILPTSLALAGAPVPDDMDGRPLTALVASERPVWREMIDFEHARCYIPENEWCAITDGRYKYAWFYPMGREQFFDLKNDPYERRELSADPAYRTQLEKFRQALVDHLRVRGEKWVKDGKLVVRKEKMLYSPHFPEKR